MSVIKLGRAPNNDWVCPHPSVEPYHAEIRWEEGSIVVVDLNSTHGTFVDGQIIQKSSIAVGQVLRLGTYELIITASMLEAVYPTEEEDLKETLLGSIPAIGEHSSSSLPPTRDTLVDHSPVKEEIPEIPSPPPTLNREPKATVYEGLKAVSQSIPEVEEKRSAKVTVYEGLKPVSSVQPVVEPQGRSSKATVYEGLKAVPSPSRSSKATVYEGLKAVSPQTPYRDVQERFQTITLGYDENNTIVIPSPQISAYHARITFRENRYWILDLQSSNGTFVNGKAIHEETPITLGDTIGLGSYLFVFDQSIIDYFEREKWIQRSESQGEPIHIGRADDNDIVLSAPQVSSHHAILFPIDGESWYLRDLGSLNGTYINNRTQPIPADTDFIVDRHDVLFLGSYRFPMTRVDEYLERLKGKHSLQVSEDKEVIYIGRDPENDLVIPEPQVSRRHAKLYKSERGWLLQDLGSANGTFVNGQKISKPTPITPEDLIGFGSYMIHLDPSSGTIEKPYQGEIMLRAESISVDVPDPKSSTKKKRILDDVSFTAYPTEFIGIMGPSGAGKTTLLMALNGYLVPSEGQSLINDLSLYEHYNSFRGNIGYVPQDDIIHPELTVYESLYYTAKLRLPPDTTDQEIRRLIEEILEDLGIAETKDVIIGSPIKKGISGGQRKRVNLAQELITQPSLLFLDEPTSGLASSDTRGVMRLLRRLANEGRTILLTIHQPSLDVYREMDNVLYLAKGKLVYYGPTYPDSILYFHPEVKADSPEANALLANPDAAMEPLAQDNAQPDAAQRLEQRAEAFKSSKYYRDYVEGRRSDHRQVQIEHSTKQRPSRKFGFRQWLTLTRRALTIKRKDVVNSAILLLQAPIIALIISLVFRLTTQGGSDPISQFMARQSQQGIDAAALFMLIASAIWFGTSNAAREIVSEQAIYRRERMVNLKIPSYVMSKFTVLGFLSLLQCTMLLGITYPILHFHGDFFKILGLLFLSSTAGIGMGLVLSVIVKSAEAAVALVPLLLIPQLVLGGLIVPVSQLDGGSKTLVRYGANAMIARWGFEGILHLEDQHLPEPEPITLSEDIQKIIQRLKVKLKDQELVKTPKIPRPFPGIGISKKQLEEYMQQRMAVVYHDVAEILNKKQKEISLVDRYFGDFSHSIYVHILALMLFNILFLASVMGILKYKDFEVSG